MKDQIELIYDIRQKVVSQISATANEPGRSLTDVQGAQTQLRFFMAMRHADVRYVNGHFDIVPGVRLEHDAGFGKLENLGYDDNDRFQKVFADKVKVLNAELSRSTSQEIRKKLNGMSLRADEVAKNLRAVGELGYQQMIAANPFLLFVKQKTPTAENLRSDEASYRNELKNEAKVISQLKVSPPTGDGLSLIFYGRTVKNILKQKPELCAAFNYLKDKALKGKSLRSYWNIGVGVTTGLACAAVSFASLGLAAPACLALAAVEAGTAGISASQSMREEQALYGGALSGSSLADYEGKRSEARSYLLAAGLAGAGVVGSSASLLVKLGRAGKETTGAVVTNVAPNESGLSSLVGKPVILPYSEEKLSVKVTDSLIDHSLSRHSVQQAEIDLALSPNSTEQLIAMAKARGISGAKGTTLYSAELQNQIFKLALTSGRVVKSENEVQKSGRVTDLLTIELEHNGSHYLVQARVCKSEFCEGFRNVGGNSEQLRKDELTQLFIKCGPGGVVLPGKSCLELLPGGEGLPTNSDGNRYKRQCSQFFSGDTENFIIKEGRSFAQTAIHGLATDCP